MRISNWAGTWLVMAAAVAVAQAPPATPAAGSAGPPAGGPPGGPAATILASKVEMQAGSATFKNRPGTQTIHYGLGYIEPFGAGEYSCGKNFPEEKDHPAPSFAADMFKSLGGGTPTFCVYKVADGDIYAYDGPVGMRLSTSDGGRMQTADLIVGGTGRFEGASGLWLGLVEGRGQPVQVAPSRKNAPVMMRVMDGFIRLPGK